MQTPFLLPYFCAPNKCSQAIRGGSLTNQKHKPPPPSVQVAGAAAAEGKSLTEVLREAKGVATSVGTMGVALTVCTLPGATPSDRLGPGKMELGLGIVSCFYWSGFEFSDREG